MMSIGYVLNWSIPTLVRGICTTKYLRTLETLTTIEDDQQQDFSQVRPYSEMPGPKPIPILGNTWRFLPFIGEKDSILQHNVHTYVYVYIK